MLKSMIAVALATLMAGAAAAQAPAEVVFRNVRVFDGKSDRLTAPTAVLVRGNLIAAIGPTAIPAAPDATVVDGGGRTLMPGLIDAHWHTMLVRPTPEQAIYGDVGFVNLVAGAEARATLMRGFTTRARLGRSELRPQAGHRRRRRARAAHLSFGRDDHRHRRPRRFPPASSELPRDPSATASRMEQIGGAMVADGPDEVRPARARAADARRLADQAHGRRRRRVAAQPARRLDLHRDGAARRRRGRRPTGAPTSPCTPTRRRRSSAPSTPACKVIEHGAPDGRARPRGSWPRRASG